jgi:hypothetical protein
MIQDLDISFEAFLTGEATPGSELAGATISFAVPDKDWRAVGTGLELDVYLYRIAENRELRSNERRRVNNPDGSMTVIDFPVRVECTYLITAWNKAAEIPGLEKEKQEHRLLSQVLRVLFRNPTLPRPYLSGLIASPELDLPMISAQAGDDGASPDFWSGLETYVRPSIHCRITLEMPLGLEATGMPVTTIAAHVGGEQVFVIGGTVRNDALPSRPPIADAWIRLDPGGRIFTTDRQGRFVIEGVPAGNHTLTVRAVGFQQGTRAITVPDGPYDLFLVP